MMGSHAKSKTLLGVGVALVALLIAAPTARAQGTAGEQPSTSGQPARDAGDSLEEVVITGSRIRQDPLSQGAPVLSVNEEDLKKSGVTSIGDFLQRLSASGGALNTRFNSSGNFGFPPDGGGVGAGASEVDLRFLGSKRTLVLVDGNRWVNGSSASGVASATDLNTIPLSIIERIEVLTDGASAVYGSDAISGVVNVITKKQFEGAQFDAYGGQFEEKDGRTQEYSGSFGKVGSNWSAFLNVGWTDLKKVSSADREEARSPIPNVFDGSGGSSGTPQGRFIFTENRAINPDTGMPGFQVDCTIRPGVTGVPRYNATTPCQGDDFSPFTTADRYNFSPRNLLVSPNQRSNIYGQFQYEISENLSFQFKSLYNVRESKNQAAPEPLFIGQDAGNGNLLDTIGVAANNPFNPFGIPLDSSNLSFIGRRPLEGGDRVFEQRVETYYFGGTLEGQFELLDRAFAWNANAISSRNNAKQRTMGGYNSRNLMIALGDPAICAQTPGCTPVNFFGGQGNGSGTLTTEQLQFIQFQARDESNNELLDFTFNINGDVVELPFGMLKFAAGVERRDNRGDYSPDPVVVRGESAGVPSTPTQGDFDVDEFYVEGEIPLLRELSFVEDLTANVAVRRSNYSTFGTESTSKYGLRYRPIESLLFRATSAQGLRAPGVGELFGALARFDATIQDPCSNFLGMGGAVRQSDAVIANCIALGVPADGSYRQLNPQISTQTGGNRTLAQEKDDNLSFGVVYEPEWITQLGFLEQMTLSLDYYQHEIENAIQAPDASAILTGCVTTLDPALCAAIGRNSGGTINSFVNTLQNIGGIDTSGYDIGVNFLTPTFLNDLQVSVNWQSTYLNEYTRIDPVTGGFNSIELVGKQTGDPQRTYARLKSTLITTLLGESWTVSSTLRFIKAVDETCTAQELGISGLCSDELKGQNELDDTFYLDLQGSYRPPRFDDKLTLTLGIQNVTDQDPPTCLTCPLNGFDATAYDAPGAFFYVRATFRTESFFDGSFLGN